MSKGKTANGTAIKRIEMRRCVACRQVRHKSELLRVVKITESNFALDETGKAPGRGGNVPRHPADAPERCDSSDMPTAPVILLDETGKAPGRGAYVCKSPECVQLIKKRRSFDRAFKVKVPDELYDIVKEKILM